MRSLYPRLAWVNIKNHRKTYVPYMLTCIGTIMMFYIIGNLSDSDYVGQFVGGEILQIMLRMGSGVIAVFAVIFLFYTSSFLIKQRKREFGLFNILGMEKRHISRIMFFETLYVALASFLLGLGGGLLLSKLVELLLFRLLRFTVTFGFTVSLSAIGQTLALFGAIFALTLLNTIRQIHLTSPVQLLSGGQVGEREPRIRWLLVLVGVLAIGGGYYLAITTESPLEALFLFFVAVILVIIGTYCLFTAVSVALLKLLKRNKNYYYKANHFIPVSGMIYRMKQNAVGLANICILSTMVLVMVSGTVSLYAGVEDALRVQYPRDIMVRGYDLTEEAAEEVGAAVREKLEAHGVEPLDPIDCRYMYLSAYTGEEGFGATGGLADFADFYLLSAGDYNRITGNHVELEEGEVLLQEVLGTVSGDTLRFGDTDFQIKERIEDHPLAAMEDPTSSYFHCLVVRDEAAMQAMDAAFYTDSPREEDHELTYFYGFDTDLDEEEELTLYWEISDAVSTEEGWVYTSGFLDGRAGSYTLYGSFLFLGLFLGLLFVMATVLIIYYKQISEGYEDRARFAIMQQVGMSRSEIRRAIRSQVLLVFFLPLIVACCHIAAAFGMLTRLLGVLYLTNTAIFAVSTLVTVVVFALFYAVVYGLTAREYYRIVR